MVVCKYRISIRVGRSSGLLLKKKADPVHKNVTLPNEMTDELQHSTKKLKHKEALLSNFLFF